MSENLKDAVNGACALLAGIKQRFSESALRWSSLRHMICLAETREELSAVAEVCGFGPDVVAATLDPPPAHTTRFCRSGKTQVCCECDLCLLSAFSWSPNQAARSRRAVAAFQSLGRQAWDLVSRIDAHANPSITALVADASQLPIDQWLGFLYAVGVGDVGSNRLVELALRDRSPSPKVRVGPRGGEAGFWLAKEIKSFDTSAEAYEYLRSSKSPGRTKVAVTIQQPKTTPRPLPITLEELVRSCAANAFMERIERIELRHDVFSSSCLVLDLVIGRMSRLEPTSRTSQVTSASVGAHPQSERPPRRMRVSVNAARDAMFEEWANTGMKPAQIAKKWNALPLKDRESVTPRSGKLKSDSVKKAIKRARKRASV